jgi:hypothetical protein
MIKKTLFLLWTAAGLLSCDIKDPKAFQSISFEEIPLQNLMDSTYVLIATASSGLPVTFTGSNDSVAVIQADNRVKFITPGTVSITAHQAGNDIFHEAPSITREMVIKNRDPNKLDQVIVFDLISQQKVSENPLIILEATASSGLPVKFTSSNETAGIISGNYLNLQHSYTDAPYDITIQITASQEGNDQYNPADNVVRSIRVIGDVIH